MHYDSTDSKEDSLATSVWRLYTKAKDTLPNGSRLENLTWRMMAMTLKKKEEAEKTKEQRQDTSGYEMKKRHGMKSITIPVDTEMSFQSSSFAWQGSGMTYSSHSVPTIHQQSSPVLFPRLGYTDLQQLPCQPISMEYTMTLEKDNTIRSTICKNCGTRTTPLWRRDPDGQPLCNSCGLFLKLHGVVRPLSLKSNIIKKRNRTAPNESSHTVKRGSINNETITTKRQRRHSIKNRTPSSMIIATFLPEQYPTTPFRNVLLRQCQSRPILPNNSNISHQHIPS